MHFSFTEILFCLTRFQLFHLAFQSFIQFCVHMIIRTWFRCLILKVSRLIVTSNRTRDHVISGMSCPFFQGLTLVTYRIIPHLKCMTKKSQPEALARITLLRILPPRVEIIRYASYSNGRE